MTMLSFRTTSEEAGRMAELAERLGIARSDLLRDALRRELLRLANLEDVATWQNLPLSEEEGAFAAIEDWGPSEDWSDWGVDEAN